MTLLTDADKRTALWDKLVQHFEERRDEYRRKNDGDLDPVATARLRGRIKETEYLLSLGNAEESSDSVTPSVLGED